MTTAIVTGAAGGIGTSICERLRVDGLKVIGLDRAECTAADESVVLDLEDLTGVRLAAESICDRHPKVAVIVHCAAVQPLAPVGGTGASAWLTTFAVNVVALDVLVGAARDDLEAESGSVVAVGSVHGRVTTAGIAAYGTSKAALEGWVRAAALDLSPNVRVNGVVPGAIDTEKLREGFARWGAGSAASRWAVLCERTPLRRVGEAADVAGAVSFLVGADSRFVTGTSLVVDGGASIRLGSE